MEGSRLLWRRFSIRRRNSARRQRQLGWQLRGRLRDCDKGRGVAGAVAGCGRAVATMAAATAAMAAATDDLLP